MLLVVFHHADVGTPSGYFGVDVFFVISGFLITSLIWKDLLHDRFTLASFWERRARRIIPAIALVSLTTLLAGCVLLLPADLERLGRSAASQALFAANIFFWQTLGYFADPAQQEPLLHTWSLAVEEQFYLVFPLLLLGLFRFPFLRQSAVIFVLLLLASIASLALSVTTHARDQYAAFYLLHTRAWELFLGAMLAVLPSSCFKCPRAVREVVSLLGIASILAVALTYHKTTNVARLAALAPCIGTAFVIWANSQSVTLSGKALSIRPVVFTGLVSYSLYLWHWPLLAFSKYWALAPLSLTYRLGVLTSALGLAIVSWKFVETPFRRRQFCRSRWSIAVLALTALSSVIVASITIVSLDGLPGRFPPQAIVYGAAKTDQGDMSFRVQMTTQDILDGNLTMLGNTDRSAPVELLVWGDSHAMATLPAFNQLLKERRGAGRAATHGATAPLAGYFIEFPYALGRESLRFSETVIEYIQNNRIPNVVLVANWSSYPRIDGSATNVQSPATEWPAEAALLATVRRLVGVGAVPWIFLDVPIQPFNVPKALARAEIFGENIPSRSAVPSALNGVFRSDEKLLDRIVELGGRVIDPKPMFLDPKGEYYIVARDGVALYSDFHHLTPSGAMLLLPLLREAFSANMTDTPQAMRQ